MKNKLKELFAKEHNENESSVRIEDCTTFINMPISSDEEDKIGIAQHALEIKDAINKGAQTIAITSDFGGGKSSLVKYLETQYSKFNTKFCYVNLWCDIKQNDSTELHRSFIYQLGNQISRLKGQYISKRLSKNYGLFKISLQNAWQAFMSYIMLAFILMGALCIPLYEKITTQIIGEELLENIHNQIGIGAFIIALLIGLFLLYTADIVFSSKRSAGSREINEHELMDIYKSYICNYHLKHYIVIVEDLDRADNEIVLKFIKELRRYYVPNNRKQYKKRRLSTNTSIFNFRNRNRITFIVNIKSESALGKDAENLYPKVFDYTLNLKQIHIDNYDVIMKKLLEDNKELFRKNHIPVFKNDEIIPEFEWLKRGKNLNIRDLKNRLNATISTYINLLHKFDAGRVSLPKCIASAYINVAYEKEYNKIEKLGFDDVINLYVQDHQITFNDIVNYYSTNSIAISEDFAAELLRLIKANLLDSDYKQYFYNYPKDSYLHTNDENKLSNIILYDTDISQSPDFDDLANRLIKTNPQIIDNSYNRLDALGLLCPKCIFYSHSLMDYSIRNYSAMVWKTLSNELPYDDRSMASTSKILVNIIVNSLLSNNSLFDDDFGINIICEIVLRKSTPNGIITFRKEIISECYDDIDRFTTLYSDEAPLITKQEISLLKEKLELFGFINFNSPDFDIDIVDILQPIIMSWPNTGTAEPIGKIINYYCDVYNVLGETENKKLTKYYFEFMRKTGFLSGQLERIILNNNNFIDISSDYIEIVNLFAEHNHLTYSTLDELDEYDVKGGLSKNVCWQLKDSGHLESYIVNACATDINMIDFYDQDIIDAVINIDFYDEDNSKVSEELLLLIRKYILEKSVKLAYDSYIDLFFDENLIISSDELNILDKKELAIKFINKDQINDDNFEYIAEYFNAGISTQNTTYEILKFVSSITDVNIKRNLFENLNFDNIQYYRISSMRRNTIKNQMSDAFDFSKVNDKIEYMKITKTSNSDFEKDIRTLILNKQFDKYEKTYANYTWNLKKITDIVISNLNNMKYIYSVPPLVYNKMFEQGKYRYYVIAKILYDKKFVFEYSKLEELYSTYLDIYLSDNMSDEIINHMGNNTNFVEYLINKREYEGLDENQRLLFTNALQDKNSLMDLYNNYSNSVHLKYLSEIKGFMDYEAAEYYIHITKIDDSLSKSDKLYSHNYSKLVNPKLKRLYTWYHNR